MSIQELGLIGPHNTYNSLAAAIVGKVFGIRNEEIRNSLSDFRSLSHRLEFVAKISNIEFINDSKATNVNSTWYALESMSQPVVWIAGGVDKGNDYEILEEIVHQKVRAIICLGKDNRRLHEAFSKHVSMIVNTDNMSDAVTSAYRLANKGDAILLSPACASFDLFDNYEDRGEQFKRRVLSL